MKSTLFALLVAALLFIPLSKSFSQAVDVNDSLALVNLYDSTNGANWLNNSNWLTTSPVSTWYGVTVQNGRVIWLLLSKNKLVGSIPSSLGNLTQLNIFDLSANQISGNVPSSLGNLVNLFGLDISFNQLSGIVPLSLNNLSNNATVRINNNQFTFSGIEDLMKTHKLLFLIYFPQADIPLIQNNNTISVSAGGTLSNNTYQWYRNDTLISTKTGDSTFTISSPGNYSVAVTNSIASQLTLYSITVANTQDSLALVDLYNSTNGSKWVNNTNWLMTSVDRWYGVTVRFGRVVQLQLFNNNLIGNIPASLGNLSNLTLFDLSTNSLTGIIPSSFGNLSNLTSLNLEVNQLTGSMPSSLGNLSFLQYLTLDRNQLSGAIPSSFGNLQSLSSLYIFNNQFSDSIPSSLGNLSNLFEIFLGNNQLTGSIPASLGNLSKLRILELNNNQLTGEIPPSIAKIDLYRLELNDNQLTGTIPDSISNRVNIFDLQLQNNKLKGAIPSLTKLRFGTLKLENNVFTFAGMETLPQATESPTTYAPQATIPLNRNNSILSVSAGGTPSNDTFRLHKDGVLVTTQIADSTFKITATGQYNITANNAIATQLVLYSDTTTIATLLADTTTTVTQNITGTSPVDINNGIYKLDRLTPVGANALNGSVTTIVTIDTAVKVYNGQPYVQRHYDIIPATNPSTSQATLTLYFTQQEFDNFNSYITINHLNIPLLPTNEVDNGNVRIIQLHGTFTGSSDPGNYNDSTSVLITPTVSWDSTDQWWVVTFSVTGFSGFYVSTGNFTLPITLTSFNATKKQTSVLLNWQTANEQGNAYFIVERSNSSSTKFMEVARVNSKGNSNHLQQYYFEDFNPFNGVNYYRLTQIDLDGKSTYSKVVFVDFSKTVTIKLYPNPAKDIITLQGLQNASNISIISAEGSVFAKTIASGSIYSWNIKQLPAGTYYVRIEVGKNVSTLKFVKE